MKGTYWISKSGDVLECIGPPRQRAIDGWFGYETVVPCRRLSSVAFAELRRLNQLRPATAEEVAEAKGEK